jgi:osmotically-inducible protein OsmY
MKTDSQIQLDVTSELDWDAAVNATKLDVAVKDGLVTISGQVGSYSEKWEAERAVQRVAGVKALVVKIVVAPLDARTDADIARAAAEGALAWVSYLPKESIKIQVENGWITLSGKVDWDFQRQNAASTVRHLKGVKGITDDIVIALETPSSAIKANIEAALERRFDSEDQHIAVSVSGKDVTLSGSVTSWWQRDLARDSAWNAPGVQNVKDHMTIAHRA